MAENKEDKDYKYIDYLDEDAELHGQKWVCVSFLSPEGIANCTLRGLKIRGVYATKEEADARCQELSDIDPDFHVFVGEVGKWLPWDPEPDSQGEQVYREEGLNKLMKGYKENQAKARKQEAERQSQLKEDMFDDNKLNRNSRAKKEMTKDRLRKKLEDRKMKSEFIESNKKVLEESGDYIVSKYKKRRNRKKKKKNTELISKLEEEIKEESELANKEGERLREVKSTLDEEENKANEINENILKIKTLWNKLKDKNEENTGESVVENNL